jgi:hypothetical protein
MTGDRKRPQQTFELRAGAMPSLKPAAAARPGQPDEAADAAPAQQPAPKARQPGCAAQKELILRLVETVTTL